MLVAGGCAAQRQEVPASSVPVTWPAYVTSDGALRFEYPPGWSVAEVPALANDPAGGVSLEVADGSGRVLARLDTGIIADLSCTAPAAPGAYREYESMPMPELHSEQGTEQRFVYRSLAPSGQREAQATYAVVSGQQQGPPCGLFDFFTLTESSGGRFAGSTRTVPGRRRRNTWKVFPGTGKHRNTGTFERC